MTVAGCDPHRETFTVAVIDAVSVEVEVRSFPSTPAGFDDAITLLNGHGVARVGVEGSGSNGRHLAAALVLAGLDVREVPPRRSAQHRVRRHRGKTDRTDALSVARIVAAEPDLGPAKVIVDPAFGELEVLHARRVATIDHLKRVQADADRVVCELPPGLVDGLAVTGNVRRRLKQLAAASPSSTDRAVAARLEWLSELSDELTALDAEAKALEDRMRSLLVELGSTLTEIYGIGVVLAAEIVVRAGDPTRFASEAAFARWNGTAPVEVSSGEGDGDPVRHRLDLHGCRAVNRALHIASVTQSGRELRATEFLARKRSEGKSAKEARRAHKRRLSNIVIRRLWADHAAALAVDLPPLAEAA